MTELLPCAGSHCADCQKLKTKIREQIAAFKILYRLNPTLNSEILIKNVQELIGKNGEECKVETDLRPALLPAPHSNGDTVELNKSQVLQPSAETNGENGQSSSNGDGEKSGKKKPNVRKDSMICPVCKRKFGDANTLGLHLASCAEKSTDTKGENDVVGPSKNSRQRKSTGSVPSGRRNSVGIRGRPLKSVSGRMRGRPAKVRPDDTVSDSARVQRRKSAPSSFTTGRNNAQNSADNLRRSKRERRTRDPSPDYSPERPKRRKLSSEGPSKYNDLHQPEVSESSSCDDDSDDDNNVVLKRETSPYGIGGYGSDEYSSGPDEWSSAAELMGVSFDDEEEDYTGSSGDEDDQGEEGGEQQQQQDEL